MMDGGGDSGRNRGGGGSSSNFLDESSLGVPAGGGGGRMSTVNYSLLDRWSYGSRISAETVVPSRDKPKNQAKVPGDLFGAFYGALQNMNTRLEIFEVLDEWMVLLENVIAGSALTGNGQGPVVELLKMEWETWDLIRTLFFPRLNDEYGDNEENPSTPMETRSTTLMEELNLNGGSSSSKLKKIEIQDEFHLDDKTHLFAILKKSKEMQEMKLILCWLEANYARRVGEPSIEAKDIAWEHTLDTLKKDAAVGKKNGALVMSIDPDVVSRTGKALHPLDAAEEERIMRGVFSYLRRGDKDAALAFLVEAGHPQKAFALFGATPASLMKISNNHMEEDGEEESEEDVLLYGSVPPARVGIREEQDKSGGGVAGEYPPESNLAPKAPAEFRVTGNSMRDLWQSVAWQICESKDKLAKYDRAAYAALLPHTGVLLEVANTWEDKLWARIKGSLETRLEEELRASHSDRGKWEKLPAEFWEQGESLGDILTKVDIADNANRNVEEYGDEIVNAVSAAFLTLQRAVMVNKVEVFLNYMDDNIEALLTSRGAENEENGIVDHLVRFLIHALLFFAIVDLPYSETLTNIAAEAFIRVLVRGGRFESTPFYIQKLSGDDVKGAVVASQIDVLMAAKGSEDVGLLSPDDIRNFLLNASINDLPLLMLSSAIVEKYREDAAASGVLFPIQALEWLRCTVDLADNAEDALSALIALLRSVLVAARGFLLAENMEKTGQVIAILNPQDITDLVTAAPQMTETIVREFVCYKELLDAEKAYSIWRKSVGNKPLSSQVSTLGGGDAPDITWDNATAHHAKVAAEGMLEVLKFPGGWLKDVYSAEEEEDAMAVDAVRRVVLKKVVFIILNLLTSQDSLSYQFFPLIRSFTRIVISNDRGILPVLSVDDIRTVFRIIESATRKAEPNLLILPK